MWIVSMVEPPTVMVPSSLTSVMNAKSAVVMMVKSTASVSLAINLSVHIPLEGPAVKPATVGELFSHINLFLHFGLLF